MKKLSVSICFSLFFLSTSHAANAGKWTIEQSFDEMTDKASCIGFYDGKDYIQLTADNLSASWPGKGGNAGYSIRFDSAPAETRLAANVERDLSIVLLTGSDYERLRSTKRLRIRVLTLLNQIIDYDIDTSGIAGAINHLQSSKCQ